MFTFRLNQNCWRLLPLNVHINFILSFNKEKETNTVCMVVTVCGGVEEEEEKIECYSIFRLR